MGSCEEERREAEYHSKDFDWEELRSDVEDDPRLSYHFTEIASLSHSSSEPLSDSDAWKRFHTRHSSGKFFKERRYLLKEFPELLSCREKSKLLEVGCGSGSTVISILRGNQNIVVYACDCSAEILDRAKQIVEEASSDAGSMLGNRFHPFHCDLSITGFPSWLACKRTCLTTVNDNKHESFASKASGCCVGGVDFVSLIFTLSAIPLNDMPKTIKECFSVLKPGGLLFFRDYGLYDMTMLRFEHGQRVGVREYMRSDGTRSYFFCLDTVRALVSDLGFVVLELDYCCIKSVNRRNGKSLRRVWVHGKFQKPV